MSEKLPDNADAADGRTTSEYQEPRGGPPISMRIKMT